MRNEWQKLTGAVVVGVDTNDDQGVRIDLSDGRQFRVWLDADCCSASYYTDPAQFAELVGATILSAEERDGASSETLPDQDTDEVSWHFLVFETDRGHVTIDWRNDSNGYYDGTVYLTEVDRARN